MLAISSLQTSSQAKGLQHCNRMDLSNHKALTQESDVQDSVDFQLQVDFFRKLGYSTREVKAVLLKLGLSADTNTVLGELVRSGGGSLSNKETQPPDGPVPVLAARGGNSLLLPHTQEEGQEVENKLRPIVIDGSNVAMSHGNKEVFSCRGILLAVTYFLDRGHTDITVFVPSWRKEQPRPDVPITDQHILRGLEKKKIMVFTPSRRVGGKRVVCYDDRFIVKLAHETDGIIVSNDTYRDLQGERPDWKRFIEERLLMYSFVNDKFMPPDDPLGRHGPSLDNFLRKKPQVSEQKRQPCPYGKKCTYGVKCKFHHPERANQSQQSLADELREKAKLPRENIKTCSPKKGSHPAAKCSTSSASLERDLERLNLDGLSSGRKSQYTENTYWGGTTWSDSKMWGNNHSSTNMDSFLHNSQERLDSGLGSYESQYSEVQQCHLDQYRPKNRSSHCTLERIEGHPPYCPHVAYSTAVLPYCQDHNFIAPCPPTYSSYGDLYTGRPYSLPNCFHQTGEPTQSEKYWVAQSRSNSLPDHHQTTGYHPQMDTYRSQWTEPQQGTFEAEREDVRKKLHAIFNPYHVDEVMGMYPQLLDPQKIAAKVLVLKSRSGAS